MPDPARELPLRVTLLEPPAGVAFAVQLGRSELLHPTHRASETLSFDFVVTVRASRGSKPKLPGPAAQGRPDDRFVYVNSGKRAGQFDSCWDRRAKVPLTSITHARVEQVLGSSRRRLEARIAATAGDGGPACATVPLVDKGWRVIE